MSKSRIVALVVALLCGVAAAQPSTYFLWKNTKTGAMVCEPEAIGADWQKVSGPYEDPNCKIAQPT